MNNLLKLAFLFCLSFAISAFAQDVIKVAPEHNKVIKENQYVRVIENTLAPGEKDAMHTHAAGWYYVKQPGTMKVVHANGKVEVWEAQAGEGGWLTTLDPHTSENTGKTTLVYVLVEVKSVPAKAANSRGKLTPEAKSKIQD
jgi:oxalate decarboxylase/phosphoglucose isomerase-like protein (cupin superfamily)